MREFTLYDIFLRNANIFPERIAISAGDSHLTFSELRDRCDRLAGQLTQNGIQQGDRVALLALNHPGYFILIGALARIGAILVPLNWRLAEQELKYIVDNCQPAMLYADAHQLGMARQVAEPLALPVAQLDGLLATGQPAPEQSFARPELTGDSPFCIIYTAAVEGVPRGPY